jgi:thioredoxin-like negative regulator of GroEL
VSALILRTGILALVGLLTWAIVWTGRRYVESRRRVALAAQPGFTSDETANLAGEINQQAASMPVHILLFSSADCHQCHKYQVPTLRHVPEARKNQVSVEEIDAPASPELAQRYQVLTLPTTVVLDGAGRVQAVNYGLANTQRLLEQVDAVLATAVA